MKQCNNYVLGLDIGITSVGYGVIDLNSSEVIDYGVRLFKEATASNNETRRTKRGARRLIGRKTTRLQDALKLFKKEGLIKEDKVDFLKNPYELRNKGLNNKLTNQELVTALYHLVKVRGSGLEVVETDEAKASDAESTKKTLQDNDRELKQGKFVCQIQLERYEKTGKIRGTTNNFRMEDYVKEAEEILKHQDVSEKFKEDIKKLIERKREYHIGPGSAKSITPYGRFTEKGQVEPIDLIEKMRGKCSLYPTEPRAPKMSYSAELFNLLNDLNNMKVNGEKIEKSQKDMIIEKINEKGNITVKQLAKLLEVHEDDLTGLRIDKNDKKIITELKGYKELKSILKDSPELYNNHDLLDDIAEILTKTKGIEDRKKKLKELSNQFTSEQMEELAKNNKIKGYHSLSLKAIKEISKEMLISDCNQMEIITTQGLGKDKHKQLKGRKNIKADDEAILSPVAKRAQREAFKVVNRLRKKYGEFDSIIVETTRMKNSDEEKAKIKESQKYFESLKKDAESLLISENSNVKLNRKLQEKLVLYNQQHGKTAYLGKPIDLKLLITDPTAYEIDHIIPISISNDDSINNKALVTRYENQVKGNLTPLAAFRSGKFSDSNEEKYRALIDTFTKGKSRLYTKRSYYLYEKDITKFENTVEFIARNLVDTSYANRVVLNTLQDYFNVNDIDTKVHTVKGKATGAFRKRVELSKDRNQYAHHAIDALIIASIKKHPRLNAMLTKYKYKEMYDSSSGEVFEVDDDTFLDSKYISFLEHLTTLEKEAKFSHKIDTKPNRQVADDTLYSTRKVDGKELVVKKFKDIYDKKAVTLANWMINDKDERFLMYHHDIETYKMIKEIIKYYCDEYTKRQNKEMEETGKKGKELVSIKEKKDKNGNIKSKEIVFIENPLAEYKETNGVIRKVSKKNNGPEIHQMKYYDGELGNHISIWGKNHTKGNNVVLLQLSPYRTDFYYSKDRGYKFVTVRYKDVRYSEKDQMYFIDEEKYHEYKCKKDIDESFEFCFSMHRDELIGIKRRDESEMIVWKFTATNNDANNLIECKPINHYESKQIMLSIGRITDKLEKYATDVLGNVYKVKKQELKLKFK